MDLEETVKNARPATGVAEERASDYVIEGVDA